MNSRIRTVATMALATAALGGIATATAGSASAETPIRTYNGYGAERACNIDKNAYGSVPGAVVLCDGLSRGMYRLVVVPTSEVPLHILKLAITGSFDGIS